MTWKTALAALCLAPGCASIARAADVCGEPAAIAEAPGATGARVQEYRAVFRTCRIGAGPARLAIRSMKVDGADLLLTVDPQSLATRLEPAACMACLETTDEAQAATRLMHAVRAAGERTISERPVSRNAGIVHGAGDGAFVTADLCPSERPLDRGFIELLEREGPHTPVALSISGGWLKHHSEDFDFLRAKAASGALDITWVDHTFRHPYEPGAPTQTNFMLEAGADLDSEIFDTEKLLIARGATPSVFFRFPGLVADAALMEKLEARHLVALGADAWLVLSSLARPGSIVLVHANGNEPAGLKLFSRMLKEGKMPRPFRRIEDAP